MKKTFLLAVIPATLALTACSGGETEAPAETAVAEDDNDAPAPEAAPVAEEVPHDESVPHDH